MCQRSTSAAEINADLSLDGANWIRVLEITRHRDQRQRHKITKISVAMQAVDAERR